MAEERERGFPTGSQNPLSKESQVGCQSRQQGTLFVLEPGAGAQQRSALPSAHLLGSALTMLGWGALPFSKLVLISNATIANLISGPECQPASAKLVLQPLPVCGGPISIRLPTPGGEPGSPLQDCPRPRGT